MRNAESGGGDSSRGWMEISGRSVSSAENCSDPSSLQSKPGSNSALAAFASLPWCCILPAALSFVSLSGAVAARFWLARFIWLFLPLSLIFLGRAFWLLLVERRGGPWSRRLTWLTAILVLFVWGPRLWTWFA